MYSESIRINLSKLLALINKNFKPIQIKDADHLLNKNQIRAIILIGNEKNITASRIGSYLDMQKGSVTTLISSLEKFGYVYRIHDENDKRRYWLHLTPQGNTYYKLEKEAIEEQIQRYFENLDENIEMNFNEALELAVNILKEID